MTLGYLALVLHAHMPFVRHPESPAVLEERWLSEAVAECYLPLLAMLERLSAEGLPFRLTLSLSPTLMAMLDDDLLRSRCQQYLQAAGELAEREVHRTAGSTEAPIAAYYRNRFEWLYHLYTERYGRDLIGAFRRMAAAGYLDLITTAATHGFLPLLQHYPELVRAQVAVALSEFRRRFGYSPRGFWLPECGFDPGIDRILRNAGIDYCVLETHALFHARPAAPFGTFTHGYTPCGLAVFGRDHLSARQVWSATEGYPGHESYREFYRDIGFEREAAHLGPLALPSGIPSFTGLKYCRITGPVGPKAIYEPAAAEETARRHAAHFIHQRTRQLAEVRGLIPGAPPPILVAPFDAELFGHWWHEGPCFLDQLARQTAAGAPFQFITPGEYLRLHPAGQGQLQPPYSSWGYNGYAEFWCDETNHWMLRPLHDTGRTMVALARQMTEPSTTERALLNQAAREVLLAQASDWPFMIRAGTAVAYARQRFDSHIDRFGRLATALTQRQAPDPHWLEHVMAVDSLFPQIDYRVYGAEIRRAKGE
ncbi:MAG: glycoside hydrolase family 57 protein [Mycobacterium leprae]